MPRVGSFTRGGGTGARRGRCTCAGGGERSVGRPKPSDSVGDGGSGEGSSRVGVPPHPLKVDKQSLPKSPHAPPTGRGWTGVQGGGRRGGAARRLGRDGVRPGPCGRKGRSGPVRKEVSDGLRPQPITLPHTHRSPLCKREVTHLSPGPTKGGHTLDLLHSFPFRSLKSFASTSPGVRREGDKTNMGVGLKRLHFLPSSSTPTRPDTGTLTDRGTRDPQGRPVDGPGGTCPSP